MIASKVPQGKSKGTKTSTFGSPGRYGHDSTKFYASKLYEGLPQATTSDYSETALPDDTTNQIFGKSSESMDELPDCSVHLMVTSPPYNVGKEYDQDLSLEEYLALLERVMAEVYRVLVPGGRACVNLANLGRKPYIPLHAYVIQAMLGLDFLMRGEIIWDKRASASASTAWGSWRSPANPTLRDTHEYILVFSKESFGRKAAEGRSASIGKDDFLASTRSVWDFPAESARRVGHPAPFPEELPRRLMELYTFQDEVVLDPFMGSGTTAVAAVKAGRHYVGYDVSPEYCEIARGRVESISARGEMLVKP